MGQMARYEYIPGLGCSYRERVHPHAQREIRVLVLVDRVLVVDYARNPDANRRPFVLIDRVKVRPIVVLDEDEDGVSLLSCTEALGQSRRSLSTEFALSYLRARRPHAAELAIRQKVRKLVEVGDDEAAEEEAGRLALLYGRALAVEEACAIARDWFDLVLKYEGEPASFLRHSLTDQECLLVERCRSDLDLARAAFVDYTGGPEVIRAAVEARAALEAAEVAERLEDLDGPEAEAAAEFAALEITMGLRPEVVIVGAAIDAKRSEDLEEVQAAADELDIELMEIEMAEVA